MKKIRLFGRRWFDAKWGNTYNTVEIHIDGVLVHKTSMQYGYDSHFITIGFEWLSANGYIPGYESPPWRWCSDNNIQLDTPYTDVSREKDL
jgi:hypothetical protein